MKKLKVAEIRGILNENNVHYKSSARKGELIVLFNEHIGSRSKELMKKYDETHSKPNDEGIIHVKSEGASKEKKPEEFDTSRSETEAESDLEENESQESISTPQGQKVEKTENTSREEEVEKADDTREEKSDSEGEEGENESVDQQTDAEGSDRRKDTEYTSSERERRSIRKTEESTDKHNVSVDSHKAEDTQSSLVTTPVAPKKDETPFSDENVFQSSPHSSRSKKNSAGSNRSSPAVPQKRSKDGEPSSSSKKQKMSSPLADITSKVPKKPRGYLFDDDDEDTSASGDDSFLKGITSQTKSPRIKTAQNNKGLQHGFISPKPNKPSLLPVTSKVRSELRKTSRGKHESGEKITKPSSKANRKSKRVASSNNLEGRKSGDEDTDESLEKETNVFNNKSADANKQEHEDRPTLGDELLRSPSFASKLGISVSGLAPKDYKLDEPSFVLNPKDSATNTNTNTDTQRHTSVQSDDELSDEEEENNTQTNKESETVNKKTSSKRSHGKASILSILLFVTLWLALVLLGLFGYWYREQTYLIGYCGQEIDVPTFPVSEKYPNWLSAIGRFLDERYKPECTKCPSHARCYPYLEIGCYEDFVEYKPWYFDYSPVVHPEYKKCIPDTKKAEKLQIMIEVTLDLLRSRNANKNCGNTSPKNLDAGLKVEEIHELLYMMKAPYISDEEFEELWSKSLVELEKEPEIIVRQVILFFFFIFFTKLSARQYTNHHYRSDTSQRVTQSMLTLTTRERRRKTKFFDQHPYQTSALNANYRTQL